MNLSLLDIQFLGLLAAAIAFRRFVPSRYYTLFGASVSAAVIGFASLTTLLAIAGTTLLYLFPLAILIQKSKASANESLPKWIAVSGVTGLVVCMVLYKIYLNFTLPWFGNEITRQLVMLVGFSYFLFRAMNYIHMHYLTKIENEQPWEVLFFMLFPPTITSGPIQKYLDFRKEISAPRPLDMGNLSSGVYRIVQGFFYKICLAYYLDEMIKTMLLVEHQAPYLSLLITVSLYLYFFFDFAGYSHIAIGFGLLLGIKVPENFNKPFLASSLTEFWRNWHITLGDWFRDQIFIPFGGMKAGRHYAAVLAGIILFLAGLWHGLTWSFIAWGAWHGFNIFLEGLMGVKPIPPQKRQGIRYWSRMMWTNARAAIASVFFLPTVGQVGWVFGGFLKW